MHPMERPVMTIGLAASGADTAWKLAAHVDDAMLQVSASHANEMTCDLT